MGNEHTSRIVQAPGKETNQCELRKINCPQMRRGVGHFPAVLQSTTDSAVLQHQIMRIRQTAPPPAAAAMNGRPHDGNASRLSHE